MTVAIRPVATDDWPVLFDLWAEAWAALLPEIDFEARLPWFRDYLADLQRSGAIVLVAEASGLPVGFVSVDAVKQDMDQLVTARAAQRQGIGRLLVRAAKARSPDGLGLKVVQVNVPAIDLYSSEGFRIIGEGISERSGLATYAMRWDGQGPR